MPRSIELRRHTDNEGVTLTDDGVRAALDLGRQLAGGYDALVSSGAQRATQTLACFACVLREPVPGGAVVEDGLRSRVGDRWREAYQSAGSGDLATLREADPELVREGSAVLAAALRRVLDRLADGGRALAVGHSPTNEAAVPRLKGSIVEPIAKGAGVLVVADGDETRVEPLGQRSKRLRRAPAAPANVGGRRARGGLGGSGVGLSSLRDGGRALEDLHGHQPSERDARRRGSYRVEDEAYVRRERRRRRSARRRGGAHRVVALAALLLVAVALSGAAAVVIIARSPGPVVGCDLNAAHPRPLGRDSLVYAADGSALGTVPTGRNREPVALWQMSRWLPEATVAIEDRRFWHHGALDYLGIARAALADLKARRVLQGGSTITQQLVRDRYLGHRPMTLHRKLQEACLAVELAQRLSKRRVLEQYLDQVFYGHHAYGAQAAAWTYFSRPASRLTLAEAALLAGLPQGPSIDDPFRRPRAALARRNEVLAAMRRSGEISSGAYDFAVASPLGLDRGRRYRSVRFGGFFDVALRELVRRDGTTRARHGGLRVQTTLDPGMQRLADRALARWLHSASGPAGALVAIDPRTGAIRAMATAAPGRPPSHFNLAGQSHRQAGSAFKVFTLTAAIERGIPLSSVWHGPSSLTIPSRQCLNASGRWVVHNFADESSGTMTLAQAIAHSVNTIFAQVVMRVGPRSVVAVAHQMGIQSPLKPVCSITLGPEGVSPLEMTDAFATLAADGVHHDATALASGQRAGRRVLAPGVAAQVTQALTGVVRSGTGTAADPGRPAAGKTGTAEGFKDAWFCGYVPQLAACAWIGYPQAEIPMSNVDGFAQVVGGSVPARIWHDFMVGALRGQPVRPLLGDYGSSRGRTNATSSA